MDDDYTRSKWDKALDNVALGIRILFALVIVIAVISIIVIMTINNPSGALWGFLALVVISILIWAMDRA